MSFPRFLFVGLAIVATAACGDDAEPAAQPPGEATEAEGERASAEATAATRRLMAEHFQKATEARQAIIGSDIEGARAAMAWLGQHNPGGESLPAEAQPHLVGMREKAAAFGDAETITDAATDFGAMLTHCGACHAALETGPRFMPPPPPQGDTLPDQMRRHAWAADRMWEGLVTQDAALFTRAATVLDEVTLSPEQLPAGVLDPERVQGLIDHVHELGDEAGGAADWDARVAVYGRFLATCAACHRVMGVGDFARQIMEESTNTPSPR